jgi:hypothetical protein
MKFIAHSFAALLFTGTLMATLPASATVSRAGTPFDLATRAYRGQVEGIPGYQTLESGLRTGNITGEDILKAAGVSGDSRDANLIEGFLRDNDSNH